MHVDRFGLIVTADGDGGDTCHRMYTSMLRLILLYTLGIIKELPDSFSRVPIIGTLEYDFEPNIDGIYIRHPDPNMWYSDPRNHSRDQIVPVICFQALMSSSKTELIASQARAAQLRLLRSQLSRYMFAQNIYPNWVDPRKESVKKKLPDFINFEIWGALARTWIKTRYFLLALPFVLIGDFSLVLSVLFKCFAPINVDGTLKFRLPGPNDVDDDNINSLLMLSQHVFQTPLSWIARKIYKRFRPQNNGNLVLKEKSAVMGALMWYHKDDNPEIAEIAREIVERY